MSDNYTPTVNYARSCYATGRIRDLEAIGGRAVDLHDEFDRMIESVRAEERDRIARNIEAQIDPHGPDFSVWNTAVRRAARIVREGA